MKFFLKLNQTFSGYFDPVQIFVDNKINIFRGYITDISAKKASLIGVCFFVRSSTDEKPPPMKKAFRERLSKIRFSKLLCVPGESSSWGRRFHTSFYPVSGLDME